MDNLAAAANFAKGQIAYQKGDFASALTQWLPLAERGHTLAMCNVGVMYARGSGGARDVIAALRFCRGAAEQGNAQAQCNLGLMYANGLGVPRDHVEAVKWYRRAADQGDRDAQFNLGLVLARGDAGRVDLAQAHMWFDLAADLGDPEACAGRDHVAQELTPMELAEARNRARDHRARR